MIKKANPFQEKQGKDEFVIIRQFSDNGWGYRAVLDNGKEIGRVLYSRETHGDLDFRIAVDSLKSEIERAAQDYATPREMEVIHQEKLTKGLGSYSLN